MSLTVGQYAFLPWLRTGIGSEIARVAGAPSTRAISLPMPVLSQGRNAYCPTVRLMSGRLQLVQGNHLQRVALARAGGEVALQGLAGGPLAGGAGDVRLDRQVGGRHDHELLVALRELLRAGEGARPGGDQPRLARAAAGEQALLHPEGDREGGLDARAVLP